ncbi:hypothetical protein [Miniphocaeibacter massiliensis]|uniref:hypothetical protein n=1 Tax=Miniphocaeibacter massiliensis TaxID=2041841 RepID=UPI000C1C10E7|nr:hypothetical protein [Miniphocaeibacter massiliensis]
MRKKVLILCLATMLIFTACSKKENSKETKQPTKETEQSTESTEKLTLTDIEYFNEIMSPINDNKDSVLSATYDESSKTLIIKEKDNFDVEVTDEFKNAIVDVSNVVLESIGNGYTVQFVNKNDEVLIEIIDGNLTKEVETTKSN